MNNHVRNRKLLDLAYELACTFRLPGICEGGFGEPAHSNRHIHGKGGSIKAHDCFFAAACRSCHREIDQGKTMSREEKFAAWDRAHAETMVLLWQRGFLKVAA